MPVIVGPMVSDCIIETIGAIEEDKGQNNTIKYLK